MEEFLHKFEFLGKAPRIVEPNEEFRQQITASVKSLSSELPEDFRITENPDLLCFTSDLVVLDMANANGDCMTIATAKENYKNFERKFLDIEHDRKFIVGCIVSCFFTSVETGEIVPYGIVDSYDGLLQLTYWGYIWKSVNKRFAELVYNSSVKESPNFGAISSSFEVGANGFDIAVGSEYIKDAKIITDASEKEKYIPFLKASKGSGKTKNGSHVYRVIAGKWLPLGAGLVSNPASQVKGLKTYFGDEDEQDEDGEEISTEDGNVETNSSTDTTNQENIENKQKKQENTQTISVKENIPMTIQKIEDITAGLFKEEVHASQVAKFLSDKIAEASELYTKQAKEKEESLKLIEAAKADAENRAKELEKQVSELATKLNQFEEEKNRVEIEAKFNARMSAMDETFELEDSDRAVIAEDIKACADDKAFETYFAKMKSLMKEKTKEFKKIKASKMKEAIVASAKEGVEISVEVDEKTLDFKSIVASAKPIVQTEVPNGAANAEPTLAERMEKAFGGSLKLANKQNKTKQ